MSSAISGMGMSFAPQAMTGASMRMPPAQKMSNLFSRIDTNGSGSISQAQFSQAFATLNPPQGFQAMGADNVFAKLDTNHSGSISKQDFVSGMTQMMSEIRQQRHLNHQAANIAPSQTIDASLNGLSQLAIGSNVNTKA